MANISRDILSTVLLINLTVSLVSLLHTMVQTVVHSPNNDMHKRDTKNLIKIKEKMSYLSSKISMAPDFPLENCNVLILYTR